MPKNFRKYCLHIFSLTLLISVLTTSVSICTIIINNCESEETSCCCKDLSHNNSLPVKIEKSCCCEIKEAANQPAEITVAFSEGKQNIPTYEINTHPNHSFDISEDRKLNVRTLSIHSQHRENIYILNSNFRI